MVQKKFIVPNLFTGLNFLLGIYAILLMAEASSPRESALGLGSGDPPVVLAAWILIWCVLLDKLDGFAAKLLKASSEFGAQFDSLADLTAFGIAPGFLAYFYAQSADPAWFAAHRPLMLAAVSVYMLCTALRLARFNAIDAGELQGWFHGLPSTFAGGFIATHVILFAKYDIPQRFARGVSAVPLFLILAGLLMVSPFYLPKVRRWRHRALYAFQIANVFIAYLCGFGKVFPELIYLQMMGYGIIGFAYGFFKREEIEKGGGPFPPTG